MRRSCGVSSSGIGVNITTNSRRVVDFLRFHELNREFIPNLRVTNCIDKPDFVVHVEVTRTSEPEINLGDRTLSVRLKKSALYLPDVTFALLSVFANLYAERNELLLHSTVVNFGEIGILILGEQGDGKKELSWELGKRGAHMVSCENTVVGLDARRVTVHAATDLLHLDTILLPDAVRDTTIDKSPGRKAYFDRAAMQSAGVNMDDQATIFAVLFCKIIPGSTVFYQKQMAQVDALLRIYRNSGTYTSGSSNIFVSAEKPFPNLETDEVRTKRLALSRHMAASLPTFEAYGDTSKAAEFLELVCRGVKQ